LSGSLSETSPPRWGVLGGIFDPVHYAHLAIAEQARTELDLDAVLFVPAGQPVHREPAQASAEDRVTMLELATVDNPAFMVSRYEVDRPEPSYMSETLDFLAQHSSKPSLALIVSSETVALMPTSWRDLPRILDLAEIGVVSRQGYPDVEPGWLEEHFPGRADRFHLLTTSRLGHSSTDIRARIAAGKSIRYLVPPAVEAYISEHGLYAA
jgi:nicotinate-nucleotide adenylyltransferase